MASATQGFGYSLRRTPKGWRWTSYGVDGVPSDGGLAQTRRLAAACIIRALVRSERWGPPQRGRAYPDATSDRDGETSRIEATEASTAS